MSIDIGQHRPGPETILIFRIGSLGDTVCALPCFHQIARSYPDCRRIVVTNSPNSVKEAPVESVLGDSGLVHGSLYFPAPARSVADMMRLRREIRRLGARTLIYIPPHRPLLSVIRDFLFFRLCGVTTMIGVTVGAGRYRRIDPSTGEVEFEGVRLARTLRLLGPTDLDDRGMWDLRLQPAELAAADTALAPLGRRPFAAVSIGGKVRIKDWGEDNWAALLRMMAPEFGRFALVFVGSADERERNDRIAAAWPGQSLNLCGDLAPRESAAVMQRAAMFAGHDSGPMHLAAAVNVTCLALFGNNNPPRAWHPYGPNHHVIHDMRGVRAIAPALVLDHIRSILRDRKGPLSLGKSAHETLSSDDNGR